MKTRETAVNESANTVSSAVRDLAIEGLILATFKEFEFFIDEGGDVCVGLESNCCTEVLPIYSVAFEFLFRFFAKSKGLVLTEHEWMAQLIKIEDFIESLESEGLMDEAA